jgi:hypothetical protein
VKTPLIVTGELSDATKRGIERDFEDRHNALTSEQYCDPLFRTIVNVTFIRVEERVDMDALVVIEVDGRCRGCPEDSDLFYDPSDGQRSLMNHPGGAASGRKVEIGGHSSFLRGLGIEVGDEEEEVCYCDATPTADRAPTDEEVFVDFEESIPGLNDTSVMAPTDPPSAAPSDMPSGSPTKAPTSKPTPAPTANPTSKPTPAPTANPTHQPTSSPTSNPTSSPAPSYQPTLGGE